MSGSMISSVASFLGAAVTFASMVIAISRIKTIRYWLVDRQTIIGQLDATAKLAHAQERRAEMAETMARTGEMAATRLSSLEDDFNDLLGYVVEMYDFQLRLERHAKDAGVDLSVIEMPCPPRSLEARLAEARRTK